MAHTIPSAVQLAAVLEDLKVNYAEISLTDLGILDALLDNCRKFTINSTNRLDPANRFPTHLLERIFRLVAHGKRFGMWDDYAVDAVTVSHVCRRWRTIALRLPKLWTFVDADSMSSDALLAFIQRSQNVPMHIHLWNHNEVKMRCLQSNSHCIRALHLYMLDDSPWTRDQLHDFLHLDLPQLEDLTVDCPRNIDPQPWPAFLKGDIPTLKTLSIANIVHLPPVQIPSLTRSAIVNCDITFHAIFALLSHSPLLQEVVLRWKKSTPALDKPLSTLPTVRLDHLAMLTIDNLDPGALAAFVSNIDINSMAAIRISVFHVQTPWVERSLPDEISQLNALQAATSLYIMINEGNAPSTVIGVANGSLPAVHLQMHHAQRILFDAVDLFPLNQIAELWLGPDNSKSPRRAPVWDATVSKLLQRLPALQTLAIHVEYLNVLLSVLFNDVSLSKSTLCPQLKTIRVGWNIKGETELIPESVWKFAGALMKLRPEIQVFVGTTKVASIAPVFYTSGKMTPALPTICTRTMHYLWPEWETCFSPYRGM